MSLVEQESLVVQPELGEQAWWARADLAWQGPDLCFAGRKVEGLARQFGTPAFFYSAARVVQNIERLKLALRQAGLGDRSRVLYAMKANRFVPLLTHLRQTGLTGIDACSPNEVLLALSCGFAASQISFTNTSLSRQDFELLSRIDDLRVNCDSLHAISQWGRLRPGSSIGIRINPAMGVSRFRNEKLQYAGETTTKFGVYREQFEEALAVASRAGLTVETIHFHTGCGYLTGQLPQWGQVLGECRWFTDQVPTLKQINVGGGLGVPHLASDSPLDLSAWATILKKTFADRPEVTLEVEPGDYLVKDAGILLLTVGSVEFKRDTCFVGVNGGFNIACEPVVYGLPFHPVPAVRRPGPWKPYTIAGHINEALDLWYRDIELPPLAEDDVLCLINAGAYSSSMASNHCMRGEFREFLLF